MIKQNQHYVPKWYHKSFKPKSNQKVYFYSSNCEIKNNYYEKYFRPIKYCFAEEDLYTLEGYPYFNNDIENIFLVKLILMAKKQFNGVTMNKMIIFLFVLFTIMIFPIMANDNIIWMSVSVDEIKSYIDSDSNFISKKDEYGMTPLMHASEYCLFSGVVRCLLEEGSDVSDRDNYGMTALMFAAKAYFTINLEEDRTKTVIEMLIDAGASINTRDILGRNALMHAAKSNPHKESIETLIERGAELNASNKDGQTALILAVISANKYANSSMHSADYNEDVVIALLNAGADVNIKDDNGKTAWDYIKNNGKLKETEFYWLLNDLRF